MHSHVMLSSVVISGGWKGGEFTPLSTDGAKERLNGSGLPRLRHYLHSDMESTMRNRQCARGNDVVPPPITFGDLSVAFPRPVGAGLATGMRQLHPSHAALLMSCLSS